MESWLVPLNCDDKVFARALDMLLYMVGTIMTYIVLQGGALSSKRMGWLDV